MARIQLTFTNIIEESALEEIAISNKWQAEIPNPNYDINKKQDAKNTLNIPNPVSKIQFAIGVLARKTGAIVTHEITHPKINDISSKEMNTLKETVYEELKQNFILNVVNLD